MKNNSSHYLRAFIGALGLWLGTSIGWADDPLSTALTGGKFSLDGRLRWEEADQTGLRESNVVTLRTLFGYTSASLYGFQGMVEGENVALLTDASRYNAAGTNPDGAGRTVIADPTVTDLNQAWLSYHAEDVTLKTGRQRLVLDNARFIGDSGWRQNMQTFDMTALTLEPLKDLTVFYGYLWRVSRVYGNKTSQPDFTSDSHLINLSYRACSYGTLTAYAYLLDFKNSAANSSDTYGASFAGAAPLSKTSKLTYRAEYATQEDAANNPLSYRADYWLAELGGAVALFEVGAGYEVLGSDAGRKGFATPLATLHAFNGWADLFVNTPVRGLRDSYASLGIALPGGFPLKVVYHEFRSDFGSLNYGNEWDAQLLHKIGRHWTAVVKFARYDGKVTYPDTRRFWVQTEYSF